MKSCRTNGYGTAGNAALTLEFHQPHTINVCFFVQNPFLTLASRILTQICICPDGAAQHIQFGKNRLDGICAVFVFKDAPTLCRGIVASTDLHIRTDCIYTVRDIQIVVIMQVGHNFIGAVGLTFDFPFLRCRAVVIACQHISVVFSDTAVHRQIFVRH